MKVLLNTLLFTLYLSSNAQQIIEWTSITQLKLKNFQSPQTEINPKLNSYTIYSGTNMNFNFNMSNGEFMFTKNFNSKVKTTFNKSAAVIVAPDSVMAEQLVAYAQFSFD